MASQAENPYEEAAVKAVADLCSRAGAVGFEIGLGKGDLWYALADYGDRVATVGGAETPGEACSALAAMLLDGGLCACGKTVRIFGPVREETECLWSLQGDRWTRPCSAPTVQLTRGPGNSDYPSLARDFQERLGNRPL
jgi:hypothetical protein